MISVLSVGFMVLQYQLESWIRNSAGRMSCTTVPLALYIAARHNLSFSCNILYFYRKLQLELRIRNPAGRISDPLFQLLLENCVSYMTRQLRSPHFIQFCLVGFVSFIIWYCSAWVHAGLFHNLNGYCSACSGSVSLTIRNYSLYMTIHRSLSHFSFLQSGQ